MGRKAFPEIRFHQPSSNRFVFINGQKFPSMPKDEKDRTCSFHKNLPEFITSQYTTFRYSLKEERCILCKNFKLGADSRDVHVQCARRADMPLGGTSKVLPLKIHSTVKLKTGSSFSRSARKKAVSCPPNISASLPPLLRNSPVDFLQPILKTNLLLGSMRGIMKPVYV